MTEQTTKQMTEGTIDAIGRLAIWLSTARATGMTDRAMAERLANATGEMAAMAMDNEMRDNDAEWLLECLGMEEGQ